MPTYMVAYVKIKVERNQEIQLVGVCFGGVSSDRAEAEEIARECARSPSHTTAHLPRVWTMQPGEMVIDTLYRAEEWFERKVAQMREADAIVRHSRACRRPKRRPSPPAREESAGPGEPNDVLEEVTEESDTTETDITGSD